MKFTLSWLRDHLESDADLATILERITTLGLEVEGVEDRARDLAALTVAHVTEAAPHPNADRLRVCRVATAEGEMQVVCGAPNARTGMKAVFAPAGSYLPGLGTTFKAASIRGVESKGMLVSEREVGLSDEHEGIIELPEDAPLGASYATLLGLDDPVIDVKVTPNRGDCLGVRGIARDLAAAGLGRLKPFDPPPVGGAFESPRTWRRDLPPGAEDACPYVAGRTFRNVRNGPSPAWLQRRLRAIGLRPISALVDITNYVTCDLGRPLHVFDGDRIQGDLTMRLARDGETLPALDGETYELDSDMVVIADERGAQGIGGIMGGEDSGCTEATTNVFLEVALFDPVRVARTGRRLGILSDARYRFERGLDPTSAEWGVEVASRLIQELCGGEASDVVSAGALPDTRRHAMLRPDRVRALGGVEISGSEQQRILEALGFEVAESGGVITATVPPWRNDIEGGDIGAPDEHGVAMEGEASLVEEILRVHGYDRIPVTVTEREHALPSPAVTPAQSRRSLARAALTWRGLLESVTFSFVSGELAELFGGGAEELRLLNPIASDLDVMRPSVLPGLAAAAGRNADRGFADVGLFEIGQAYLSNRPEGQIMCAAGLRLGRAEPRHWATEARLSDALDAKGDALAVLEAVEARVASLQTTRDAPAWYHPGRSGVLRLGPNVLAQFGEMHPRVLKALDMRGPLVAFEVFLDAVPGPRRSGKAVPPLELSSLQPVERDFAFLVNEDVEAEAVLRAARSADKALITDVQLFDVYTGKGVEAGKKSLAIAVTLQPTKATLTESDLEGLARKVVAKVEQATGGSLRG